MKEKNSVRSVTGGKHEELLFSSRRFIFILLPLLAVFGVMERNAGRYRRHMVQ
jgi:hypothetical protein